MENNERILCAAIHLNDGWERPHQPKNIQSGLVICGHRHHNILIVLHELKANRNDCIQGFLTDKNFFVMREEAADIAYKAQQIKTHKSELYSEDLY